MDLMTSFTSNEFKTNLKTLWGENVLIQEKKSRHLMFVSG